MISFITNSLSNLFSPATDEQASESEDFDPGAKDPCGIIPLAVVVAHLFSYLNFDDLLNSNKVSKQWKAFANAPVLWKPFIYEKIAFSSKNWAQWNEEIVKDVDLTKEMQSLPDSIVEELRRSYKAFPAKEPEKGIKANHVLVIMPKGLSIRRLGEFAKKYFPNTSEGYGYIWPTIMDEIGDKTVDEPIWLLMTSKIVKQSKNKTRVEQQKFIAALSKAHQVLFEIPTILDVVTCVFAEYSRSQRRLFNSVPTTSYTFCQETFQDKGVILGGFAERGFLIKSTRASSGLFGVTPIRKFNCH